MSGPITRPWGDIPLGIQAEASERSAQVIQIDNGKHVAAVAICATICGLCLAATVGTVWHHKEREVETQARIRVLQNHIDDTANKVAVMQEVQNDASRRR